MRLFLLPLLFALAAPNALAQDTFEHSVDQARHFIKKGWYVDARNELLTAVATAEGARSYEVHWLLSQVYVELQEIGLAIEHAEKAMRVAPDQAHRDEANEAISYYKTTYAPLKISGPQDGISSRLQLEITSTLFDPELKKFVSKIVLKAKEKQVLPVTFWLPMGTYLVNGHEIEVVANQDNNLELPMGSLGNKGLSKLQVSRVEFASGFGVFFGEDVANLLPGIETQLAITQPVGRLLVGVTLDKTFRSYRVDTYANDSSPLEMAGGIRLGTELFLDGPLALRPSIGYRYGILPGVGYDCAASDSGYECAEGLDPVEARYYAITRAHIPYAELSIDYRSGGNISAFGLGIRIAVDQAFGSVPKSSTGYLYSDESQTTSTITIQDSAYMATGLRLLANISFAL